MNVTFLMQDTGTVYGAERATIELAGGLQRAGHTVRLLLIAEKRLAEQKGLRKAVTSAGLEYVALEVSGRFSWKLIRRIRAALRKTQADVLHTVGYKANVHGGSAARWGNAAGLVATVHGWLFRPDVKEQFYAWVDIKALKRFGRVVALSHYYSDLLRNAGVAPEKVALIPSGLREEHLPAPDEAQSVFDVPVPFTFGVLGRLSWEKNHELFLDAFARVKEAVPGVRAVIAGDGPLRGVLEERVRDMGLGEDVSMPGYVDKDNFFRSIHAMVLCSRIENLPYSVLEAMAWCRPVIATNVGGLPDLVRDGETGFLVGESDVAALAQSMAALARDPQSARSLGKAGREQLIRSFSLSRNVEAHIAMYGELCGEAG